MSAQLSSGIGVQRQQHSRVPRLVTVGPTTSGSSSSHSTLKTSTSLMTTQPIGPYSSIPSIALFGQKSQIGTGFLQHPSKESTSVASNTCVSHPLQSQTFPMASRQTSPLYLSTTAPVFQSNYSQTYPNQPNSSTNAILRMPQSSDPFMPSISTGIVHPHSQPLQAQQPYTFDDNDDVDDPDEEFLEHIPDKPVKGLRGIGQGKAEPKKQILESQFLSCGPHGGFCDKFVKKSIYNLIRINFNTRYVKWDKVPKFRKDKIWNQFEMRYWWDPEDTKEISDMFDKTCRKSFSSCLNSAKKQWESGFRVKWLTYRQMKRLVRYWQQPDVVAEAERMRSNRGVRKDENGKNKPAPKTYKGGSVSMHDRDREEAKSKGRKFESLRLETFVRTHVKKIPNLAKDEIYTGQPDLDWEDGSARQRYERYVEILNEKYSENTDQMPTPLDPIDSAVWQKVVGGVKRGRIPGLSYEINPATLGFDTKCRPPSFAPPQSQQVESYQIRQLKEQIEAMARAQREMLSQSVSNDHSQSSRKSYEAEHQSRSAGGSDGQSQEQQEHSCGESAARDIGEDFMELLRPGGGLN